MCGVAGVLTNSKKLDITSCLKAMEQTQKHRGPDMQDTSEISIGNWTLGLAHQRLSVLDLSEAGAQPMVSSGRSCIIYNGEVYNYQEIKAQMQASEYRSEADTEVVLNALETFGIKSAVNLFNGMWAFAWLNYRTRKLYLCRDRVGVKPLYYYLKDDTLFFSSEVKTILVATGEQFSLDYQAVGDFLVHSVQNTESNTFYEDIKAVPAAHYIEIDLAQTKLSLKTVKYWDVLDAKSFCGDDLVGHVQHLFEDAVRIRMRSDVPVGVTLSGGLDSSSIAVMMKKNLGGTQSLNIISAVSSGETLDESEFIDLMANSLDSEVHKIELGWKPSEAMDLLKESIWYNDAPIGSFSNVAYYLMMKKAHELGVTVILSGQGADELLCGYKKYLGFYLQSLIQEKRFLKVFRTGWAFLRNRSILTQFSFKEAKRYLPKWFNMADIDIRGDEVKRKHKKKPLGLQKGEALHQRQANDLMKFSVPYLTHYEDRMSMAWSREIRLPFLDYRLMELFLNQEMEQKINKGWTKFILRKAMVDFLPKKIVWRKDKQGFVNPQEEWLRNDLVDTVLAYFHENALIFKYGLVNRIALLKKYEVYRSQSSKKATVWYRDIFNPLSLEIWLQLNKEYLKSP